jgi:trimeric autotransporter adhesin
VPSIGRNLLTWTTANEINNKGFDIERSDDGKVFKTIGFVKGYGTTTTTRNYTFTDNEPLSTTTYYRLRQVDFDGKAALSNVVSVVKSGGLKGLKVYPNPTSDNYITIDTPLLSNDDSAKPLEVINTVGQVIFTQKNQSQDQFQLDISNWASGLYFIKMGDDVVKFVKN